MIPFCDLRAQDLSLKPEIRQAREARCGPGPVAARRRQPLA